MYTMDTQCNFPNRKYKMPECLETNSNSVPDDESLLRQPLRTSYAGFWEAKKAYENGTDEVRRLLMQECSLIYECNACRNMFRSLSNFISHKRNYCKIIADNFRFFSDHNSNAFIQTIDSAETWLNRSSSTVSSLPPNIKSTSRDLSKVIERLKRVEVSSESKPEPKAPDPVLELESVSSTTQAVYQTLKNQKDCDSIKTEVDEIHNLLKDKTTLLGTDGKAVVSQTLMSSDVLSENDCNMLDECSTAETSIIGSFKCEICKIHFLTEKTFKMHVQKKHTSNTYVFQCPSCPLTFLQPAAVIRHLANEHKKPLRRIRKMRGTILKKRTQRGDVKLKGPNREMKRLKLNNTKDFNGSNIGQQSGKPILMCMYCKKDFEKRAALVTHFSSCIAKNTSLNSAKLPKNCDNLEIKICNQSSDDYLECNDQKDTIQIKEQSKTKVSFEQKHHQVIHSTTATSTINQMFENLETQTFGSGIQTVSLKRLEITNDVKESEIAEQDVEEMKEIDIKLEDNSHNYDNNNYEKQNLEHKLIDDKNFRKKMKTKCFHVIPPSKELTCRCKICNKQFNALSNLRRHISMFHYRSRRFGCNFCDYRAFRRYDIVNHLMFVHKMTEERESMAVEHVTVYETKYSKDDVDGDIVVVKDESNLNVQSKLQQNEKQNNVEKNSKFAQENSLKTYEKREKRKNILLQSNKVQESILKIDTDVSNELSHIKAERKKLRKSYMQHVEGQKRPIRNRIKTVNKDFVYDLLTLKEDAKELSRPALKRRNSNAIEQKNLTNVELKPPPIKLPPYRLRTEPLIPVGKNIIKGYAANIYRNVIHGGLAAPSTLPELPAERPQIRPRLMSSSRSESNNVPIIETSELEAARLKSTFFDDSFLEKFAKKSNPSFKMKPLLELQHSPLSSILQRFSTALQRNNHRTDDITFLKSSQKNTLPEIDLTPNGMLILESSSPPSAPKKRITLMQRLAENRAKRRDSLLKLDYCTNR